MSRWFELTFGFAEAILLKKAVRVFSQVAYTDRELPHSMLVTNLIPNLVELQLSPNMIRLVSRNSVSWVSGMTTTLVMTPSDYWCSEECRTLCISLHRLQCLLERNTREDSITVYGDDEFDDVIFFEFGDGDAPIYSTLPVISWQDEIQMVVGFQNFDYPMRLGLSSESFHGLIMNLESHGFTVHARVSATQVVFRVGNNEMEFRAEPGEPIVCEIDSDGGTYPFVFQFDLQHKSAFLNASILSDMVWMFTSVQSITTLSFPIDGLGDLILTPYWPHSVAPS